MPQHPFDNGELKVRDELLAPFPRTEAEVRRHIAAYYAMISEVDAQIGRVLDAVEASPHSANTYIIFAGDNGLALGRHGLLGKQNLYDHSLRVPMVISGPGIPKGVRSDTLCHLMDICPTILDLAGASYQGLDARSLRPALKDPKQRIRDSVAAAYRDVQRAVRTGDEKLILYRVNGQQTTQLFDLRRDPDELENLASKQPARVAKLTAMLKQGLIDAGDDRW